MCYGLTAQHDVRGVLPTCELWEEKKCRIQKMVGATTHLLHHKYLATYIHTLHKVFCHEAAGIFNSMVTYVHT